MRPNLQGLAQLKNGTVLLFGIRTPAGASTRIDTRGKAGSAISPYVAMRINGLWCLAGPGETPPGAVSWRGLERWLSSRDVAWIDMSAGQVRAWPSEESEAMGDK